MVLLRVALLLEPDPCQLQGPDEQHGLLVVDVVVGDAVVDDEGAAAKLLDLRDLFFKTKMNFQLNLILPNGYPFPMDEKGSREVCSKKIYFLFSPLSPLNFSVQIEV